MTILHRIVSDTRELVANRKQTITIRDLEALPYFTGPTLPFAAALRKDDLAVIAEIKRASPSKGPIRPDLDAGNIAKQYKNGGAAALSILTEPLHFGGNLEDLVAAREAVDLPLLRKDFIVDPFQLVEARAHGADAVLLIATVLDRHQLYDLHQAANELRLSCLVEVYALEELDRIDFDQVAVLGVNNRDLHTFEVDVDRALAILAEVPSGVVTVAESGLRTAQDFAKVRRHSIDAVLVGESFMRADRPGDRLQQVLSDTRHLLGHAKARLAS